MCNRQWAEVLRLCEALLAHGNTSHAFFDQTVRIHGRYISWVKHGSQFHKFKANDVGLGT
jgi:hypothetical protein